jgi:hypothetical protein
MFEDLTLTPSSGTIDVAEVSAWLAKQDHAFFDPVSGDGWHMSATRAACEVNRRARVADPSRFSDGIRILVSPDAIEISVRGGRDEMSRVLQFMEWLASRHAWIVTRDRMQPEPLGDPRRLFAAGLVAPALLDHDPTLPPLTEGTLATWTDHRNGYRSLAVHSSGQWRYEDQRGTLRGRLTDRARESWNAAMSIAADAPPSTGGFDPDNEPILDIETPSGLDTIGLGQTPPPEFRSLSTLATNFITDISNERSGSPITDTTESYWS